MDWPYQPAVDVGEPGQLLGQLCERRVARNLEGDLSVLEHCGYPARLLRYFAHNEDPWRNGQPVTAEPPAPFCKISCLAPVHWLASACGALTNR